MRDETVSRNYAETLFELAREHEGLEVFEEGIATISRLLDENPDVRRFLETPRIADAQKKAVVRTVFEERLPRALLHFLLITIDKRRQRLLREIAREFQALLDQHFDRAHVEVTVAREMDDEAVEEMGRRLSNLLDMEAIPRVRVKPEILGGVILRTGDTIYDGSLRRRLESMKRRLNQAELPKPGDPGLQTA